MNIKQEKLTIKTEMKAEIDKNLCASRVEHKPVLIDLTKIKKEFDQSGKNNSHLYVITARDIESLRTEEIQIKSDDVNCTTTTTTTTTTSRNNKRKRQQKANSKNVKKYCNKTRGKTIPKSVDLNHQVISQTAEKKCSHGSLRNTAFKDKFNLSIQVQKRTASNKKVPKKPSKSRKKREAAKQLKKVSPSDKNVQSNTSIPGSSSLQAIIPPEEVIVIDDTEIEEKLPAVNASKTVDVPKREPKFNPQSTLAKEDDKVPPTKRIVDLNHVLNWALPMQTDHSRVCAQGKVYLSEEHRLGRGLVSRLIFACTKCTQTFVYETDPEGYHSKINKGFVRTTLSIGCTYDTAKRLLRGMGVPSMTERTFKVFSGRLDADV